MASRNPERTMTQPFVILTGASGSGKTAIAEEIEKSTSNVRVFRFDTIGVPSVDVMATFGSGYKPGGAWQRAMTLQWIERIVRCSRQSFRCCLRAK